MTLIDKLQELDMLRDRERALDDAIVLITGMNDLKWSTRTKKWETKLTNILNTVYAARVANRLQSKRENVARAYAQTMMFNTNDNL